jgi:hypothetical protein
MAANIPFFRGQNCVLKAYQNGKPVTLLAKVWDVDENATEIAEGVNGEHRDRLDKVTNYYSTSVDMYQTDQEVMQAIMDAQDVDDANGLPLKQTCAIQINHRDGTKAAYILQECKFGPFKESQGGRADAVMLNLKIRFRYFKPVPTI